MAPVCSTSDQRRQSQEKKERDKKLLYYSFLQITTYTISHSLQKYLRIIVYIELTSVELHEGRDQLFHRQRVVLHHFRESLSTRLYCRVGDKQHLHQLSDKVGVPDVVLAADEHYQEGDDVLNTRLI